MNFNTTTVEELKSLYVKMGGSIEDVAGLQTDAELIDKIEDIYEAGASLPDVTASDNGDVLTVVEGAWSKAEPQSTKVYNLSMNSISGSYNSPQIEDGKTLQDIFEDITNGRKIEFKLTVGSGENERSIYFKDNYSTVGQTFYFSSAIFESMGYKAVIIRISGLSNVIQCAEITLTS